MYIDVCLFVYLKFLYIIDDLVWVILFLFLFVLKKSFLFGKMGGGLNCLLKIYLERKKSCFLLIIVFFLNIFIRFLIFVFVNKYIIFIFFVDIWYCESMCFL